MALLHIQRIKNAFEKLLDAHVDLSDWEGKPEDQREKAFLSRALAAYALTLLTAADPAKAAEAVTDGFDDNGLDAVYFDQDKSTLYVVQSKWIEDGSGSIPVADCKKFLGGFQDLVNLRLERFNDRVRAHETELRAAMLSANVQIVLVIAYSGIQGLSEHVRRAVDDLLADTNDPVEIVTAEVLNQEGIYNGIMGYAQRRSINLELMLQEWGYVKQPFPAYYGQVDAASIAQWWTDHGRNLFARNLRNFKGSTDVNDSLASTLKNHPDHFWYFNNGITVLCSRIAKKVYGGASRDSGMFECEGVSIVNGAQTVGMIGSVTETLTQPPESARVLVRLISLEDCPDGFDKSITRATNTQNRIERRDFASQDPNQQRLASEFLLDRRHYAYKTGDADPDPETGCSIVDATVALACAAADVGLAVQAKREIGRLWDDIEAEPYTLLFNERTTAIEVWRAVEIMRVVDRRLEELKTSDRPRADMVAVHGNRLILHRVFQDSRIRAFRAENADVQRMKTAADDATCTIFARLADHLEAEYPNAYLASLFKNANKCRDVDVHLAAPPTEERRAAQPAPQTDSASPSEPPTLFD